ncbi:MCE family protein [Mycobacterium paraintracellulare]|uniref:MCE family protein n=1 Tax=Mycobacterium paraintracellulare TaxID=1138383 RepID=UPI0019262BE1|nr:MlaD family protein [Mycobacterium paraintracellulare]BCP14265.1 virulence factor Mce [Mycobacterium paraintracellulare]
MLSRFVRIQLTIFTVVSIVGVLVMAFIYMQVPMLLGIGRIAVTLELPGTGGLYRLANVTYRGVNIGKVLGVQPTSTGATATLSLQTSPKVPANLQAQVHSMSAVGEQYVDLQPRTDTGPYLHGGSVIPLQDSTIPQSIGPVMNQVSALIGSIPQGKLSALLDEMFKGFDGAGYDLGSIYDSSSKVIGDLNGIAEPTKNLVDDSVPLLDAQAATTDSLKTWAQSLAGITEQIASDDTQVRTLLRVGPDAANEVARLLSQIKPTLPLLLANLTTVGQVVLTYNPSLQQLLVLLPPSIASSQSFGLPKNNPTGMVLGDATVQIEPPACTVGFLPPSSWRSPADTTDADTPDGLYCKLPQDSPISVRGARNYPCIGQPGKRAPTVQICKSDKAYEPLAMRAHVLGPYPLDPSLLAQGVLPDDRINFGDRLFGPPEGTPPAAIPPPPGPTALEGPPPPPPAPNESPQPPATAPDAGPMPAAPSAYAPGEPGLRPQLGSAHYDPLTGYYVAADGQMYRQSNLPNPTTPRSWKDMLPT